MNCIGECRKKPFILGFLQNLGSHLKIEGSTAKMDWWMVNHRGLGQFSLEGLYI